MASSFHQPSPIAKTAFDSLQAKQSALSVGYTDMVVQNASVYNDLLGRSWTTGKLRQQTALVNVGYVYRVLAVSHAIHSFVNFHQHTHPNRNIQIVFLGCGVDIIGLWAHSLVETSGRIRVVEVDMPSVCAAKKDFLIGNELVFQAPGLVEGQVLMGQMKKGAAVEFSQADYFLLPIDLGDISALNQLLRNNHVLDPSVVPTLVVSELVLTYLNSEKTDQLLSWCSSELVHTPGSAMLALEPLGYDDTNLNRTTSVAEGYRRDYCRLFERKMEQGKATITQHIEDLDESSSINPLGKTLCCVKRRLLYAGFSHVEVNTLFSAAACATIGSQFRILETFDEHTALILHLRAYSVSVAFSSGTDGALVRLMCPASYVHVEIPPVLAENNTVYTTLEPQHEDIIRNLFYNTYAGYFDAYPAIRKMVKGVMDREFTASSEKSDGNQDSDILARYRGLGGSFFVALHFPEGSVEGKVVGCIGVRQCERQGEGKDNPGTLEVFRLAVDEKYRGQGVGRRLLMMVESFARLRDSPKLIAKTLTVLEPALKAYESCGYEMENDTPLGTLTMRTYCKPLSTSAQ